MEEVGAQARTSRNRGTTLVKNGEICGTEILSENLIKMELGEKLFKTSATKKEFSPSK